MSARPLTKKQEAFAIAISKGLKPSEAYCAAYGAGKMSAKAISVEASRLIQHPKVSLRIERMAARLAEKHEVSVSKTIEELARGAYCDPEDGPTWGEKITALDKLMRFHGLYQKDNEQSKAAPQPVQVQVVLIGGKA